MPTMIEEQRGTFVKPKSKRQETRKRSPKACLSCRARKVRCDVAFVRDSCTNCVLDGKRCVVSWRRRQKDRNHSEKHDASEAEPVAKPLLAPKEVQDSPTFLIDEDLGTPKLAEARPRQSPSQDHTQAWPGITFSYYPFLCINNLSSLHKHDIDYLESQGCFTVPESNCLDDLVRAFFRYAHQILPVVNEAEFWSMYNPLNSGSKASRVPVILLSAMLFVACKYVGNDVLQCMQPSTAREARDKFFRQTQLLYDQETESSPVVLAQVCLLLAHWSSQRSSRASRQSTQWLSRAINHSQHAISEARLWTTLRNRLNQANLRRLWGCCILSDCIHSFYTRRPLMVPPIMVEAEEDYLVLSRADLSHEIGRSRVYGVESKQQVIEAQEQMSALITILRKVLAMIYPQQGTVNCRTTPILGGDEQNLRSCKNHLKAWYNDSFMIPISERDSALGSSVSPGDGGGHGGSQHDPVELLVSMMYLHYETAMLALCHSELLLLTANPRMTNSVYRLHERPSLGEHKYDLSNCILNLKDRLSDSLQHQHLSKVPESMIFCTALPLFLHLHDTKTNLHNGSSLPSSSLRADRLQYSRCPDWALKITECLRLHFKDELEYILQAVKVISNNLTQGLQESQGRQGLFSREDDVPQSSQERLQMSNWRQLLDTRPRSYARLIETLDAVISWGGPLPKTDMGTLFSEYQVIPGSGLIQQFPGTEASVTLTPASSPQNKQRLPYLPYGEGSAEELEAGATDPSFMCPENLRESLNNIAMQKFDFSQSCLAETPGEMYSQTSLSPSAGMLADEIMDGERRSLDQVAPREGIKHTEVNYTSVDDMMLGDGLSDDWVDALLEKEMSQQGDSAGRSAEDIDMEVAVTA